MTEDLSTDSNPSSIRPMIDLYSEEWWAEHPEFKRCKAHRKNGQQCRHTAMNGTSVCQTHGGKAPQVQHKAKIRLQMATDQAARYLLDMAADTMIPEGVRLSAIKDVLDRGGLGVKSSMEIEVTAKPFEQVYEAISAGPREVIDVDIEEEDEEENPGSLKARLAMKRQVDEYSDEVPRMDDLNGEVHGS